MWDGCGICRRSGFLFLLFGTEIVICQNIAYGAVLEKCQYYWWVYVWDTCGIFIWYDVGCMWDLKESENIQI